MIRIEGKEALDYLDKLRSSIPSSQPCDFCDINLPLLSKFIELESIFLSRNMQNGLPELAAITLDATGFPELESWRNDLSKIGEEFGKLREKRRRLLAPLRNQLFNASPNGILEEGNKLVAKLSEDSQIIEAFNGGGNELYRILTSNSEHAFPFYKDPNYPGLLLVRQPDNHRNVMALKYIHSFRSLPTLFYIQTYPQVNIHLGEKLKYPHSIIKAFFDFDAPLYSSEQSQNYFDALGKLNELVLQSKKFFDGILDLQQKNSDENSQTITCIASVVDDIYQKVDDDLLRKSLQVAFVESMGEYADRQELNNHDLAILESNRLEVKSPPERDKFLRENAKKRLREILEELKKNPVDSKLSEGSLERAITNYEFMEKIVNEENIKEYLIFRKPTIRLAGVGNDFFGDSRAILLNLSDRVFDGDQHEWIDASDSSDGHRDKFLTLNATLVKKESFEKWFKDQEYYKLTLAFGKLTKEELIKILLKKL